MAKKLLLADDSITIQKVVGITFAQENFELIYCDNGLDALNKAREVLPDIILADTVMPQKNGYELCEMVRKDPALAHVPVLLLTGSFETFDESRGKKAGANGFMIKPFESQALIDKVNALVAQEAPRKETPAASKTAPPPAPAKPAPATPPLPTAAPPVAAEPLLDEAPFSPDMLTAEPTASPEPQSDIFSAPETGDFNLGLSPEDLNLAPFAPDSFAPGVTAAEEKTQAGEAAPRSESPEPVTPAETTPAPKIDFGLEFSEADMPLTAEAAAAPSPGAAPAAAGQELWSGDNFDREAMPATDLSLDTELTAAAASFPATGAPPEIDLSIPSPGPEITLESSPAEEPSFEIGFPEPPPAAAAAAPDLSPEAPAEPASWLEPAAAAAQQAAPPPPPATAPAVSLSPEEVKRLVEEQVRGVIEQVVWEVVPALAEQVIKAELTRLLEEEKKN